MVSTTEVFHCTHTCTHSSTFIINTNKETDLHYTIVLLGLGSTKDIMILISYHSMCKWLKGFETLSLDYEEQLVHVKNSNTSSRSR